MFERNGFQTDFQEQFKLAVLKFNIEKINYLAKYNINPNHVFIADGQIVSPLTYAISHGSVAMLKALLALKKIRVQVLVNETTALELASGGRCKLMVSLLLKCEHINYSQSEINKAFYKAHQANSPSVEIFLDDYFEQIIVYSNDIQQNFQKDLWVLELLGKEVNRRYLFNKLINYLSQSDDACAFKLLSEILNSCQENSSQQHPFARILTIQPRPAKQATPTLFSTTESELEQLQKYYQSLNRENNMQIVCHNSLLDLSLK